MNFDDVRRVYGELGTVWWLEMQLELVITRQTKSSGPSEGIGKSNSTPLFWNEQAAEAEWILRSTLQAWVNEFACDCEVPYNSCLSVDLMMDRHQPIANLASFLIHNIAKLPDEAVDEILAAIDLCRRAIDTPEVYIYLGDCGCGNKMYGDPSKDSLECARCLEEHHPGMMRLENQRKGRELIVTAADAARYLGDVYGIQINRHRINVWASRGKLEYHQIDEETQGFRLGDIIDLAKKMSSCP